MNSKIRKIRRIAAGECDVWLALREGDAGFRRLLVLKESSTDSGRDDLVREASIVGSLCHPNLIQVHDFGTAGNVSRLIMEYVDGASLRLLTRARPDRRLGWAVASRIIADAARGLGYAHMAADAGGHPLYVVHRDVTPANLVVSTTGFTKVVDFGIARSRLRAPTHHGVVRGTFAYLSPEQSSGGAVDWRTDVFSLGLVFFELLTGARLLGQTPETLFSPLASGSIPALPASVPATCADVLRRMVTLDPARRAFPMDEIADALENAITGQGGSHSDVALVLQGELGPTLTRHRQALQSWLDALVHATPAPIELEVDDPASRTFSGEPTLEERDVVTGLYEQLEHTLQLSAVDVHMDDDATILDDGTRAS